MRKSKNLWSKLPPAVQEYLILVVSLIIVISIFVIGIIPIGLALCFNKWQYLLLYLIIVPLIMPIFIMIEEGKI